MNNNAFLSTLLLLLSLNGKYSSTCSDFLIKNAVDLENSLFVFF